MIFKNAMLSKLKSTIIQNRILIKYSYRLSVLFEEESVASMSRLLYSMKKVVHSDSIDTPCLAYHTVVNQINPQDK